VAQAVKICEQHLLKKLSNCYQLPSKAENPFPMDYCPEMDISDPLDSECSSFYQHLIGVMRWMVELGRVDIVTKISLLSSHLAYPCVGHLEVALHIKVKRYLINHLISMMLSGQCFVFLFRQGTEQPHQGDVNTRVAIPNTTKEVRNRIMLDPEIPENPSFVYGEGGGG
jgi:hypothetical protein